MILVIKDGEIKSLYNEKCNLTDIGVINISRASHVEYNNKDSWYIDLSPIGINKKVRGFNKRTDALKYEKDYIEKNIL